jgi:tetratricopeptide (TPR) repeat protein
VIEPTLQAAEIRRAADRPTSDPTAYDLYLRVVPLWASHEKEPAIQALGLLGRAIERDPRYGPALGLAALCHQLLATSDWTNNSETHRREGIDLARRALRCAPDDPDVLANAAVVLGSLGEDIDIAIGSIDRALALNPSFARGWVWSASRLTGKAPYKSAANLTFLDHGWRRRAEPRRARRPRQRDSGAALTRLAALGIWRMAHVGMSPERF